MISADPCRQQGERVRGGLTSIQDARRGEEFAQNESRLQKGTSRVAVGNVETREKSRFGASF